jgi:phosphatidylglycerol:prolipoprotein diacylglycerol transferase
VLPFFQLREINIPLPFSLPKLGDQLPIQPFGVMLAIGVLVGSSMARRYLDKLKMDDETLRWLGIRILIWGFIACHIINTLTYEPGRLLSDPLLLIKVWDGISSYGGVIGALIAFYFLTRKFDKMNKLRWLDMLNHGVVPGYFFGRVGCAIVHDHIGIPTKFPLAINFDYMNGYCWPGDCKPINYGGMLIEGGHHDLGLYEVPILGLIWLTILLLMLWKNRPDGLATALIGVMYSIPRFFLEPLRLESNDPRYLGLTPAQYMSIVIFGLSAYVLYKIFVMKKFTRVTDAEDFHMAPPQKAATPAAKTTGTKSKKPKKK